MPIIVTCQCGRKLQAPDNLAGKTVKCPKCTASLTIPVAISAPQAGNPPPSDPADPLGLGDLGQYESTPGADPLGATGNPLGDPLGGPLQGQAPMGGPMTGYGYPQQTVQGYGWPQQPAGRASGGTRWSMRNVVLILGGVGAFLLLLVGGLTGVILFSYVRSDSSVASADDFDETSPATPAPDDPPEEDDDNDWSDVDSDESGDDPFSSDVENDEEAYSSPAGPASPSVDTVDPETVQPEPEAAPPPTLTAAIEEWRNGDASKLRGAFAPKDEDFVPYFHSWQTQLLPYLGRQELYDKFRFDQPWTQGQNLAAAQTLVPQFLNPADDRRRWKGEPFNGTALTHFVGMSGVEEKRNEVAAKLPRSDDRAGMFGYDRIAGPNEITDGQSQTVMILGSGEMAGPWAEGGGYTVRGAREPYFDPLTGFGSRGLSQPGTLAVFADGSVREISANVSPEVFRAMCTIHGAETVDQSHLGRPLERLPFKNIENPSPPERQKTENSP